MARTKAEVVILGGSTIKSFAVFLTLKINDYFVAIFSSTLNNLRLSIAFSDI